jgi:diguanylate cyclase (GGDEF)-like protein
MTAALVALLGLHTVHAFGVSLGPWSDDLATWFPSAVFAGCGCVCLKRARASASERRPWSLIGAGLVVYGCGSVVYNLELAASPDVAFPSLADALWLSLYPLAFAGMVALVRARHVHASASLWLDGLIGGSVIAAAAASFILAPVFALTVATGWQSVARLAYPFFDLVLMGFAVVLWGAGRWRLDAWLGLAAGFALIAVSDALYVVDQLGQGWTPGSYAGLGYVFGAMCLAAAAWRRQPPPAARSAVSRVGLPIAFSASALALVTYEAFAELSPVAVVLIRLTLLAVVLRLGFTLWWLSRQRADLEALAASDPLTGVGNYRAFQERLAWSVAEAAEAGSQASVAVLDLDHFKAINDTFGHTEGDLVLQAVATSLAQTVGDEGFVARVGGEEFAILTPRSGPEAAAELAERCRSALALLDVPGRPLACSAGVAGLPAHGQTAAQLLQAADAALYWAKRSGRDRIRLYDPRHAVALSLGEQRREVEALLASPASCGPVFQPLMEIATGRVAGYEALARFAPPFERPPDLWFAQAHRCGLGPALEAQAIRAALAVAGPPAGTFLALNVSPAALMSAEVQHALPEDLSAIVIELTEHDPFDEDGALELALSALRLRGARIALDDAGAGYAGLQQLIRIRPDIVKVDRSLVASVHEDASKLALLEALARFATETGAAVCAEGVEDLAELRALAGLDVTYAQGYALCRPGPPWPALPDDVAAHGALATHHGMRVPRPSLAGDTPSLGEVTDALARVAGAAELDQALQQLMRLLGGQEIALSTVDHEARCLETVSQRGWVETGERFSFEEFPTTEQVIDARVTGQVISGDPASDPAELEVMERAGMAALLLVPLIDGHRTVALLEVYRRSPQAWTNTQVDWARVLAIHVTAGLARVLRGATSVVSTPVCGVEATLVAAAGLEPTPSPAAVDVPR